VARFLSEKYRCLWVFSAWTPERDCRWRSKTDEGPITGDVFVRSEKGCRYRAGYLIYGGLDKEKRKLKLFPVDDGSLLV